MFSRQNRALVSLALLIGSCAFQPRQIREPLTFRSTTRNLPPSVPLLSSLDPVDRPSLDTLLETDEEGEMTNAVPIKYLSGNAPALQDESIPSSGQAAQDLIDLKKAPLFDWALLGDFGWNLRLGSVAAVTTFAISLPIASITYSDQPLVEVLCTVIGTSCVLLAFLLRLFAGWGYVNDRLTSGTAAFDENDGSLITEKPKSPAVAMRDRLLVESEVKPALDRVKRTALPTAAVFALSVVALRVLAPDDPYGELREDYLKDLRANPEQSIGRDNNTGKPGYCRDRYYKALAGGSQCD